MVDVDYPRVAPLCKVCINHKHTQRHALIDTDIRVGFEGRGFSEFLYKFFNLFSFLKVENCIC